MQGARRCAAGSLSLGPIHALRARPSRPARTSALRARSQTLSFENRSRAPAWVVLPGSCAGGALPSIGARDGVFEHLDLLFCSLRGIALNRLVHLLHTRHDEMLDAR